MDCYTHTLRPKRPTQIVPSAILANKLQLSKVYTKIAGHQR